MVIHSLSFQLCRQILIFVDIIAHVYRSRRKKNSSEIPAHRMYRSVKKFLRPVKLQKRELELFHPIILNFQIDFVGFFQYMFGSGTVSGSTQVIVMENDWIRRMLAMVQGLPAADKNR